MTFLATTDDTSSSPLIGWIGRHRAAVQITLDSSAWAVAIVLATLVRYDLSPNQVWWGGLLESLPVVLVIQLVAGLVAGLYQGRWRYGSFEEVAAMTLAAISTTTVIAGIDMAWGSPHLIPGSAVLAGGFVALVLMAASRYVWRMVIDRGRRPVGANRRVLVFGAGEGGVQVVTAMLRDPDSPFIPVGLLDDDQGKRRLRVLGVPVLGGRQSIATAAAELDADTFLIAIPSASHDLVTELTDLGLAAGLVVNVLPPVGELFPGRVGIEDIRPLAAEDLLGRNPIQTDVASIAGYLTGKRVLVTGAGGSIGSELCRQITRFGPARLIMVDRNENALHQVQLSIEGRALLDSPDLVLLCIRDRRAVREAFALHRPEVVFHAAALKHLTLLERHPAEALKTNVWGTINVLDAAAETGVQRFVNISTDKAADPISVLGYSKRIAERITASMARNGPGTFLSVRFGNVLGSDGSVLKTFESQLANGGPLTVTDPEITRYFMTIAEAVELVIQAAAIGKGGEALVLDMGEPVCIADLARRLAANSQHPVEIVFTGLRPGEKLHEILLGRDEADIRPVHPAISHVDVPPLDPAVVIDLSAEAEMDVLRERLAAIATEPHPAWGA